MPLGKAFFVKRFGMVADHFGVGWRSSWRLEGGARRASDRVTGASGAMEINFD
jgi:hypothetical protein